MSLIWCTRHGKDKGFQNQLAACVACHCRQRKACTTYAAIPLEKIVAAKADARKNGHTVDVELPLFEMTAAQK